jgi:hypothetical protein
VRADECTSVALSVSDFWAVGAPAAELVAAPAVVRVSFEDLAVSGWGSGTGKVGGGIYVSTNGSDSVPVATFDCVEAACSLEAGGSGTARVVEVRVPSLPGDLRVTVRAEVYVREGSGRAGIRAEGDLALVAVSLAGEPAP